MMDEARSTDGLPANLVDVGIVSIGTAKRSSRARGPEAIVTLDVAITTQKANLQLIAAYARKRDELRIDEWIALALRKGASLAHKWAKCQTPIVPPVSDSHRGPIPLLDCKRHEWLPRWQRDWHKLDEIESLCNEVHNLALAIDPVQIDEERLAVHMGRARASRATGLDGITNQDIRHAPPAARPGLCIIINEILRSLIAPAQWRANAVQLIPKPKGGDRPITVTSTLYSLVMDILGVQMNDWQEEQQAFWDDAIKGSSALQAALHRRLYDELDGNSTQVSITGYCDLEKFYDSIDISKLIHHALACDFPLAPMSLLLQVHLSTRIIRVNTWVSEPLLPFTSIIAGCRSSGHLARVLLYPILQHHHEMHVPTPGFPQLHFRCFVDDLVFRVEAPTAMAAASRFAEQFG
jgi:hypothetical protein